jgi:hypothetical protein
MFEDDYPADGFQKQQENQQFTVFLYRKQTRSKLKIQVEANSREEAMQSAERIIGFPWQAVFSKEGVSDVGNHE